MPHQYFSQRANAWLPIPGRVYRARLPICEQVPALRDHPLIVHRSIEGRGWTVTHSGTGAAVAHGRTRNDALENAQARLLNIGGAKFLRAIAKAEKIVAKA